MFKKYIVVVKAAVKKEFCGSRKSRSSCSSKSSSSIIIHTIQINNYSLSISRTNIIKRIVV